MVVGCSATTATTTTKVERVDVERVDSVYVDRWRQVVLNAKGDIMATHDTVIYYRYKLLRVADTLTIQDTIVVYKDEPRVDIKGCFNLFIIICIVLIISVLSLYLVFKTIVRKL